MILKKLVLRRFRNYDDAEIEFNSRGNLLFGNNGQGKTNLLEAIYYLSVFKSFRRGTSAELAQWSAEDFFLSGFFDTENDIERSIEIEWKRGETKQVSYENERIPKLSDIVGIFPTVILSPESLEISQGMPDERRRFIDICLSLVDKEYLRHLVSYKRVVKQRNTLLNTLTGIGDSTQLDSWNEKLIEHGKYIIAERIKALEIFKSLCSLSYKLISNDSEQFTIKYKPSVKNVDDIEEGFRDQLSMVRSEERRKRVTLVGPHRDDIIFYLDGKDARKFGSQGQHKTILLALKSGEMSFIASKKNTNPAILLDDMFALLDTKRILSFLGILKDCGQFFITANVGIHPEVLLSDVGFEPDDFSQFLVKGGNIEPKT